MPEAVAKALTRAIKEELQQSQHAAARHGTRTGQSASEIRENANANARIGISLKESLQILDNFLFKKNVSILIYIYLYLFSYLKL
ncbi:unnamed protein product [Heligmosomoides polygyrus]|uniref:BLOC-1-related complex subunit 7 n=1 Tax=Heligmosomoides polygyrus TaxID=6339 RepID=A0A183GRY9_HELPZ|nr:unnamed protein product [Heligmosomoides polygyrus]